MPSPGEVLCDDNFQFTDGPTGKKLLVFLNNARTGEPCLACKTTSQSRRYQNAVVGCNPDKKVFYVPKSTNGGFIEDTYIQLDEIFSYSAAELLTGYWQKRIRPICNLPDLTLRQLKNCLKTVKRDISERDYEMIFRK